MTARPGIPWAPLVEGAAARRAEAVVREIADAFAAPDPSLTPSLGLGEAGVALCYAYLDRAWPGAGYGAAAQAYLAHAVGAAGEAELTAFLFDGLAGIGWLVEHLTEEDGDDVNHGTDELLLELCADERFPLPPELYRGAGGFALYGLERAAATPSSAGLAVAEAALARASAAWTQAAETEESPGVAHGLAGCIGVLASMLETPSLAARARAALSRLVARLSARVVDGEAGMFLPEPGGGAPPKPGAAAWCSGEAGAGAVLRLAGERAGVPAWREAGLAMQRQVAARPLERFLDRDICVCHGASGQVLMFARAYQATGEPGFAAAARLWSERLLDWQRRGEGVGGYTAAPGEERCLLYGAAGVALALTAAVTQVEPAWDRILLLSPPARAKIPA